MQGRPPYGWPPEGGSYNVSSTNGFASASYYPPQAAGSSSYRQQGLPPQYQQPQQQQQQAQNAANVAYQEFQNQRNYPFYFWELLRHTFFGK